MSHKELSRLEIMQQIAQKRISQVKAAEMLGVSDRQVRRLYSKYSSQGAQGLISKHRDRDSNRRLPESVKELAITLIRQHYTDFGPTFAQEKLEEVHGLRVSVSALRTWMIEADIWSTRNMRIKRAYQPRYRRPCRGELIQIDGSPHLWFEDRGPYCTLLVYVDDATSEILHLSFVPEESTFTYFEATKAYILKHGKPIAFYSDKYSVFRVNSKNAKGGDKITQFGRALLDVNIDLINANTCQAKGRVERANKTLQDRLIKEMRLLGIRTLAEGNAYVPKFIEKYNAKFGKEPLSNQDMHRPLMQREKENLDNIFCWQEDRTLSSNLTLQYDKRMYLIEDSIETRKLTRKRVTVHDYYNGSVKIMYDGKSLPYRIFDKLRQVDESAIIESKRLGSALKYIREKQKLRDEQRSKSCPSRRHQSC